MDLDQDLLVKSKGISRGHDITNPNNTLQLQGQSLKTIQNYYAVVLFDHPQIGNSMTPD